MPLYGNELDLNHNQLQPGLEFLVIRPRRFRGRDAMVASKGQGEVLIGLKGAGKRPPRAGYPVLDGNDQRVGVITSGTFSPTLGYPVAMAWVSAAAADGTTDLQSRHSRSQH